MNIFRASWARWLPWVSLAAFSALWLAQWPAFPLFLDPYYHLLIARQVVDAGGPITYEWWEHAPVGRPHLYPPVLHLLLAGLLTLGCSAMTAIRLVSALIMPAVCTTIYLVMRRLYGPLIALAALWLAMLPFAWIIEGTGMLASGIALLELLWLMAAVATGRTVAAACLLALLFYTHLGLPWVAVASLVGWMALNAVRDRRKLLLIAGSGLLLALPWLAHVASHGTMLHVTRRAENQAFEFLPALYLLAVFGAWRCWKRAGSFRLLLGLWLGFSLMAVSFTFRWLSGEGVLPVILLAGVGLGDLAERVARRWSPQRGPWPALAVLGGLLVISPSVLVNPTGAQIRWRDTGPFHLLQAPTALRKGMEITLHTPQTEQLARLVARLSQPGEILWSSLPYAGGLLAVLAHRPMSGAMFYEAPPAHAFDPIAAAHLIVWWKIDPLPGTPTLAQIRQRYPLDLVAEDQLAFVFRNPRAGTLAHPPHAILPMGVAFVLLCVVLGFVVRDFRRPQGRSAWRS